MFKAINHKFLVNPDTDFKISKAHTEPPKGSPDKDECKDKLEEYIEEIKELQEKLYAFDKFSLLLIFQAMDGAGKDSTIRAVMSGVNPAGCQVFSFKQPSAEELDHDFLWRTVKCLPERGRIGIFNRSYYEEVLVVRVHSQYLLSEKLPCDIDKDKFWEHRYDSICDHEKHLVRNGTIVLKFWLNVSKDEQKKRFLKRINEPEKNWKFSSADVEERKYWDKYMEAYEEMLNATSKPWAPWYAVPADDKAFMRYSVAQIITENLKSLDIDYPKISDPDRNKFDGMKKILESEADS